MALAVATQPAISRAAPPARVLYVVEEERTEWEPIGRAEVENLIAQAALEELSAVGAMQLVHVRKTELPRAQGDFLMRIVGRMVGEAETHTIHLSFEGLGRDDVPSFRAAETVVVGQIPKAEMIRRIDASTRAAAKQLLALVEPVLAQLAEASCEEAEKPRPTVDEPTPLAKQRSPGAPPALPWSWSEVRMPATPPSLLARELFEANGARSIAALRELTARVRDDASARRVLEHCALRHSVRDRRHDCLVALRLASRSLPSTQRVVIEVFRTEKDGRVRGEASEQMLYFTGISRAEAVQAWLEHAANEGEVMGPIEWLGDQPNLDLVIARCLYNGARKAHWEDGKAPCFKLLHAVPPARRRALLIPHLRELDPASPYYLKGAGPREGQVGTERQWAIDAVLENARHWDPQLEEILWRRYQRDMSSRALSVLAKWGDPSPRLTARLLEALQTQGEATVLSALLRAAKKNADVRPMIQEKLAELIATGAYPKSVSRRDLEGLMRDLERLAKGKS